MTDQILNVVQYVAAAAVGLWLLLRIKQRLQLSVAKYPSLGGHLRWAKRITRWVPGYSYADDKWFDADGAPQ